MELVLRVGKNEDVAKRGKTRPKARENAYEVKARWVFVLFLIGKINSLFSLIG